ncbi:MAG: hypothetical protein APR54_05215 [Candidatus Cloacimonas sp. SDB]|nr:MAG: hypothetical protein APR54_05215 [Candidatus Cloacimonas sp. SDB]
MKYQIIALFAVIILVLSCTSSSKSTVLEGAGATFPYPLYAEMFQEYFELTGIEINYQPIGSGAGIKKFLKKQVDFGASDIYLSDDTIRKSEINILHIPICLGAVALSYNLPVSDTLNLSPQVISQIYRQEITAWNDPLLAALNPGVDLPDWDIVPLHRSDASGTTFIFTEYLTQSDPEWRDRIGSGQKVEWTEGIAVKGNQGLADKISETEGALGYLEYNYALSKNLKVAKVLNRSGNYIFPEIENVIASAQVDIPEDSRIILTNTEIAEGYPLSGFSWLLIYEDLDFLSNKAKAYNLVNLIWWMTHEGQEISSKSHYGLLPEIMKIHTEKFLKKIKYNNEFIIK